MLRRVSYFLAALAVFFGGVVYASAQGETFTGCLTPGGDLKNVALGDGPAKGCTGSSVEVSWNAEGPQGPPGPTTNEVVYVASERQPIPRNTAGNLNDVTQARATCPAGTVVIGGGFTLEPSEAFDNELLSGWNVGVVENAPDPYNNEWVVEIGSSGIQQTDLTLGAEAMCLATE